MNNATLYGTLVDQPELRYTSSDQTPFCSNRVQFNERTKDATSVMIKAVAFGKLADVFHSIPQGSMVILEGSLRMNKIETPGGQKRTVPEFNINRVEAIGSQPKVANATPVKPKTVEAQVTAVDDDDDCPFE